MDDNAVIEAVLEGDLALAPAPSTHKLLLVKWPVHPAPRDPIRLALKLREEDRRGRFEIQDRTCSGGSSAQASSRVRSATLTSLRAGCGWAGRGPRVLQNQGD